MSTRPGFIAETFNSLKKDALGMAGLVIVVLAVFSGNVRAGDDFQYWSKYEISKTLGPEYEVFYSPEIRFRDDASDFFYHEHRVGLRFKQFDNLGVELHYLFGRTEPAKGPWKNENRAELDLTPKWKWGEYTLSVRGRAELRHIEGSTGDPLEWRFRFKPQIAWNGELFGHPVKPYIANDIFYDTEKDAWNQNRVYVGLGIPLGDWHGASTSLGVYYIFKSNRNSTGDWSSSSILGSKIALKF